MVRIETTYEHERLNSFYEAMGLEISEADPVGTDALKSFLAYVNDTFAGACTLAFRQGDYIIDGIAVDEQFRGEMLGTRLLKQPSAKSWSGAAGNCTSWPGRRTSLKPTGLTL